MLTPKEFPPRQQLSTVKEGMIASQLGIRFLTKVVIGNLQ